MLNKADNIRNQHIKLAALVVLLLFFALAIESLYQPELAPIAVAEKAPHTPRPPEQLEIKPIIPAVKQAVIVEAIEPAKEPIEPEEPITWSVSGSVSGLYENQTLSIKMRSGDLSEKSTVTNDGFTFSKLVKDSEEYSVIVTKSPNELKCKVESGSGYAKSNIDNVEITCRPPTPILSLGNTFVINEGEQQSITASITYPSERMSNLKYHWKQIEGNTLEHTSHENTIAISASDQAELAKFQLTVSDNYGQSISKTTEVLINLNPTFELPETIEGYAFQPFEMSANNIQDEATPLFHWEILDNEKISINVTDTPVVNIASLPRAKNSFTLSLTLTDEHGAQSTRTTKVTITSLLLTEVNYQDSAVKECVERAARRYHWKRVADVSNLVCTDMGISNFSDFEIFTSIYNLDLTDNMIDNVNLDKLFDLRSIYLTNNQLSNIELNLPAQLRALGLSGNRLKKVDLSHQSKLEYLGLSDNQLEDVDIIQLEKLNTLYLKNNKISKINLNQLTALKTLDISSNQLDSISLLQQKKLISLSLSDNKIEHLDLSKNNLLEELHVINNPLDDSAKLHLVSMNIESLHFENQIPADLELRLRQLGKTEPSSVLVTKK